MLQWVKQNSSAVKKTATILGIFFVVGLFVFVSKNEALAQSVADPGSTLQEGVQVIEQPLGLPATDIRVIVGRIIKAALGLLGIVVVVLIIYAGFLWMTAGGNEEQIGKAKKILLNSVIGLAIILSAYALVTFVINKLGWATGIDTGAGGGPVLDAPAAQNYFGSGALGKIVKDHYPTRDQTEVPRNAKIVVTFNRPIKPDSFIDDTNGDGIFGTCKDPIVDWYQDCDRVKIKSDKLSDDYINITQEGQPEPIAGAVVMAVSSVVDGMPGVYTIVVKPITETSVPSGGYLGSSAQKVAYTVRLGSEIRLDDAENSNPSAFQTQYLGNNYYSWQFTNSTNLDISPPVVQSVFPSAGASEAMNSVLQVHFSEPLDPTGIQGSFNSGVDGEYVVDGENIFLKTNSSQKPQGNFILTNNYRTLEFVSTKECGKNSCGSKIFCLPVCDKTGVTCDEDTFEILLRSARVFNASSFEAQPFTGILDMAGNALDGDKDGTPDTASTVAPVFPTQKQPDNYFWAFKIKNEIDVSAPFLTKIIPGKDAENISANQELSLQFNKRMRADSMYTIEIKESPVSSNGVPIGKVPYTTYNTQGSYVRINHTPFLDDQQHYYIPVVDSRVEDVHYNCFYPGKGPSQDANPDGVSECDDSVPGSCCEVITAVNQDFCCNGSVMPTVSTAQACVEYLSL